MDHKRLEVNGDLRAKLSLELARQVRLIIETTDIKFESVVGLARGGLDVAMYFADVLNIHKIGVLAKPSSMSAYEYYGPNPTGVHLVVDFLEHRGRSKVEARRLLPNAVLASVVKFYSPIEERNIFSDIVLAEATDETANNLAFFQDRPCLQQYRDPVTMDDKQRVNAGTWRFMQPSDLKFGPLFCAKSKLRQK
jgi:hypothetical protein